MHIYLEHESESFVRVRAERSVLLELNDYLSFVVPNHKFMPMFKMGRWDGKIRLLNIKNGKLPKGLIGTVGRWAKQQGYTFDYDPRVVEPFSVPLIDTFDWDNFNLPDYIDPYDYQEKAVHKALQLKRSVIVSATASGKSLIIYAIARHLVQHGARVLITVPSISLVSQMAGDFKEYDQGDAGDMHQITGGVDKHVDAKICVSTWQSVYKMGSDYLGQFDAILSDEVHEMEANSGQQLINDCVNAFCKIGFTGSMKDAKMNELTLTGLYGPPIQVSSNKELQDRDILANLNIYAMICKHNDAKPLGGATYEEEKQHVINSRPRNEMITRLVGKTKGSTLVLFDGVESHGYPLYQQAVEMLPEKNVYFVYRHTPAHERERIREIANTDENAVVFATYKIYQRGINIVNLTNIVLAGPTKSKIRLLQSIGRGLRRSTTKTTCNLYDLADDLTAGRKKDNILLDHFNERYKIYQREQFSVTLVNVSL